MIDKDKFTEDPFETFINNNFPWLSKSNEPDWLVEERLQRVIALDSWKAGICSAMSFASPEAIKTTVADILDKVNPAD